VGLFNFFSKRRQRESAVSQESLGSFASPEGQPVVGRQMADGGGFYNMEGPGLVAGIGQLAEMWPMIKHMQQMQPMLEQQMKAAMANPPDQAQIEQMQASGNELRDEIFGIMREHGVDPTGATPPSAANMQSYAQMQQQIMDAISRHGYNVGTSSPPSEPGK
jgi:hypothetical protein